MKTSFARRITRGALVTGMLALAASGAARAADAMPPSIQAAELTREAVAYDPAHPDRQVAARPARVHDLLGQGNPHVRLLDHVQPTEKLEYQAYLGLLPIGSVQFALSAPLQAASRRVGGQNIRARMHVQPADGVGLMSKVLSNILDCSFDLESMMDADIGRSLLFRREETVNNRVTLRERLQLDYGLPGLDERRGPVARFSEEKAKKNQMKQKVRDPYAIPPAVQDSLSAFYYARALPLHAVGDESRVVLATKKDLEVLVLTVTGREVVDLGPLGRYDCLVVEPRCDGEAAQILKANGHARMWIENNTRIVTKMQIEFDVPGFDTVKIVAPLTRIHNNPHLARFRLAP